jgi:hypothetical protein
VTLRVILHSSKKASPSAWDDVKPDVKLPAKAIGDKLTGAMGGRDIASTVGDLFGDLKLEGLDAAHMDDLGGVTDEIIAAQMEILLKMKFRTVDTVGEDS